MWPLVLVAGALCAASLLYWARASSSLLPTPATSKPRVSAPPGAVLGNYPAPAASRRPGPVPGNWGLGGDRWLDWLALAGMFVGLMYAVWLGSTPEGKW